MAENLRFVEKWKKALSAKTSKDNYHTAIIRKIARGATDIYESILRCHCCFLGKKEVR